MAGMMLPAALALAAALALGSPAHHHPPSPASQMRPDPPGSSMTARQRVIWARASLADLGAPQTPANVRTIVEWFANEGTPHDPNNPLNLQTPYDHSHTSTADGDPASIHIQAYRHPQDFPHAFGREMRHDGPDDCGCYAYIIAALRSGRGMIGHHSPGLANDLREYSGGGYDRIPAG